MHIYWVIIIKWFQGMLGTYGGDSMDILKKYKKIALVFIDILLINFAYLSALYFRFTWNIPKAIMEN